MTDREAMIEYLTSWEVGISRDDAERRLRDDDLWLVHPELRASLGDENAVCELERAQNELWALTDLTVQLWDSYSAVTRMALFDAEARVEEALRRARKRAEQATAE